MINAHSFPLLQLPFLALEAVVKQMGIKIQLALSDLSKRVRWVVKTVTSRQTYNIFFVCSGTIEVIIKDLKSARSVRIQLNSNKVAEFITKISGVFKNLDIFFYMYGDCPYRMVFELIPAMKQFNMSLHEIFVSTRVNDELCELALKAAKDAKKLTILSATSPNFNPPDLSALKLERLAIFSARWFTLDHLVNQCMNCREINVSGSELTVQDLNKFFKKWIKGSNINKFCWTSIKNIGDESILPKVLDGIPCVAVKKARTGNQILEFNDDECFMIEQLGGLKAILWNSRNPFFMTTEFTLD